MYKKINVSLFWLTVVFFGTVTQLFATVSNGKIAFSSSNDIFTVNSDGSNLTNISNSPERESGPRFSPDGRRIVFNYESSIYTMNGDGTNQVNLRFGYAANWSPDGTKIVYATNRIAVMSADGVYTLLMNGGAGYEAQPSFSPDSSRIAYLCSRPYNGIPPGTNDDICVMNADGTNEINLSRNPVAQYDPQWSPDGTKVSFQDDRGLYVVNADGTNLVNLGTGSSAKWSPDGTKICFSRNLTDNREIFTVNPDGSNPVNLSNNPRFDLEPIWSPDGLKIAFLRSPTISPANSVIFVMNSDGTNQTQITQSSQNADSLNWQRIINKPTQFDFDGDHKTDLSIFRPSLNQWWYKRSSDNVGRAFTFASNGDKIVPADYTGDGKTDIAVFTPSNGFWRILRSEDNTFYGYPFASIGDIPAPGDYDGDGKADAAVFRTSNTTWYISQSTGGTRIRQFGVSGDVPVVADYDGDGKTDIAIYRPSVGQWWYLQSLDGTSRAFQFGASTDKPVQGDYTGDGKADLAFFRPETRYFYILRSEDATFYGFPFASPGDIPVSGDYDGDGKFDVAVFNPSQNNWYVYGSTAGITINGFGSNGDQPVPSAFVP